MFFLAVISSVYFGLPSEPSSLLGAWRLERSKAMNAEGEVVYEPQIQTGILIVTKGHYSLMWTREPRPNAVTHWAATDAEKMISFNTMIAHSGRWSIEDGHLRLDALTAKSPEFVGGHELFQFSQTGDTLQLTATMAISADGIEVPFYTQKGTQSYWFKRME